MQVTESDSLDLEQFRLKARAWLAKRMFPEIPGEPAARLAALRRWQRYLRDEGWIGLSWPRDFGGQGLTLLHQATFNLELAAAGGPSPIGGGAVDVIGATIAEHGTAEQKRRLLPKMLGAEELWCQGFSEPNSGSDLASLATSAEPLPDGFVVNGRKIWSTRGNIADWMALLARTDKGAKAHQGISYLLVRMDTPGITRRPIEQLNGETDFAEITLENVRLPADALLGEMNKGWAYAMHTLAFERGCYALRRATELAVDYQLSVAELKACGTKVDDWTARQIGELYSDLYAFESQVRPIPARLSAGPQAGDVTDSLDKMFLAAFEQKLARFWREALGPYASITSRRPHGLDAERVIQRYYWSRASSIYGGTAQIQRNIVSERMLGLPREGGR
ncbi:MAG: acyl-CoA dehydrogenase family protein [Reyranellaceae bacterium]